MPEAQERIVSGLEASCPDVSKTLHVCTDTFGSIATAFPNGEDYDNCMSTYAVHMLQRTPSTPTTHPWDLERWSDWRGGHISGVNICTTKCILGLSLNIEVATFQGFRLERVYNNV